MRSASFAVSRLRMRCVAGSPFCFRLMPTNWKTTSQGSLRRTVAALLVHFWGHHGHLNSSLTLVVSLSIATSYRTNSFPQPLLTRLTCQKGLPAFLPRVLILPVG